MRRLFDNMRSFRIMNLSLYSLYQKYFVVITISIILSQKLYLSQIFPFTDKYTRYGIQKVEKIETQSDEYTQRLFNAKTLIFLLPFINYSSKGNDYNIIPLILLYQIFVVLLLKLFFPFYAIILLFLATILSQGECVYTNQELK